MHGELQCESPVHTHSIQEQHAGLNYYSQRMGYSLNQLHRAHYIYICVQDIQLISMSDICRSVVCTRHNTSRQLDVIE